MEDLKVILYILAAVAFFLYNTWRKAFKDKEEEMPPEVPSKRKPASQPQPPKPQQHRQQAPQRPAAPSTSLEDILRELQPKAERAKEQARPVVEKVKEKVPSPPPPRPAKSYEVAAEEALSLENPEEAREAMRRAQRRQIAQHEAFEAYKASARQKSKYAAMLQNPQTARDAFVLSEIFQRKYR
ncbi:hypothetical protein [Botryobacter ruber]|uniref:hypothetical protein n=1 Tax=Botryobacter ruber TaxID=2171629 RepID=UPI000E0B1B64|nr:hypothetical protein [Botryobacter ruber]